MDRLIGDQVGPDWSGEARAHELVGPSCNVPTDPGQQVTVGVLSGGNGRVTEPIACDRQRAEINLGEVVCGSPPKA